MSNVSPFRRDPASIKRERDGKFAEDKDRRGDVDLDLNDSVDGPEYDDEAARKAIDEHITKTIRTRGNVGPDHESYRTLAKGVRDAVRKGEDLEALRDGLRLMADDKDLIDSARQSSARLADSIDYAINDALDGDAATRAKVEEKDEPVITRPAKGRDRNDYIRTQRVDERPVQNGDTVQYFDIANQNAPVYEVVGEYKDAWGSGYDLRDVETGEETRNNLRGRGWAHAEPLTVSRNDFAYGEKVTDRYSLKPGDHIRVDAGNDEDNRYQAVYEVVDAQTAPGATRLRHVESGEEYDEDLGLSDRWHYAHNTKES